MYFGTDGIRGEYGKTLTHSLAFCVGNALTQIKKRPKVIVGTDTRTSRDILALSVSAGIVHGGGSVVNVKIIPTAGISFLCKDFDFGIIITASHNPPCYNGIKVFNSNGQKLSDSEEEYLEQFFSTTLALDSGIYREDESLKTKYVQHLLKSTDMKFDGLKVCIDASNGAAYKIAPKIFKELGATVYTTACHNRGNKINVGCGSLNIENLQTEVLKNKADIGFAFDGDADRIIAVNKNAEVFDGDKLLYILAKHLKKSNQLYADSVVGTSQTNRGIMEALNRHKINLIRTDVGDKYVIEAMEKMNLNLGGEQSGHIIIKNYAQTGDGILTAIKLCEVVAQNNFVFDAKLVPQANIDVLVKDKLKVINNENLKNLITKISNNLEPFGRVLVRASGTEDKIRIMVEAPNVDQAQSLALEIEKQIKEG